MKCTPDNITELGPNEVFTFGSNTAGIHGAGAARRAHLVFGAVYGLGEGLMGKSYALPTLDDSLQRRTQDELTGSIHKFYDCCDHNLHLTFLLTKVGCGLAGYDEPYIISLFHGQVRPPNIIWPKRW